MFTSLLRLISNTWLCLLLASLSSEAFASTTSYDESVAEERKLMEEEQTQEYIASGAAAILLGTYGYYNTSPNPLVKVLYAATQTAGVLTLGQAIRSKNSPRLLLEIDEVIQQSPDGKTIEVSELKEKLGRFKQKNREADARTLAYTSSILSTLYFYNGSREKGEDKTLRNVYFFLGFNFAIGAGVGFYQTMNPSRSPTAISIDILPYPSIAYHF